MSEIKSQGGRVDGLTEASPRHPRVAQSWRNAVKYSSILISLACALAMAPVALAQAEPKFDPPKTSWGVPDLQGYWSSASLTSMQLSLIHI